MFVYLKTGLARLTPYEISLLENYTFLWNLSGKKWLKEWTANVDGFVERQTEQQEKRLEELNQLRGESSKTVGASAKNGWKDGDGLIYAKALYQFLEELDVPSSLQNSIQSTGTNGTTGYSGNNKPSYGIF